jgi:hypothetical protein
MASSEFFWRKKNGSGERRKEKGEWRMGKKKKE